MLCSDWSIPSQYVSPPILVRNNVALAAGAVAGAGPEEGVLAVAIVDKVMQHQGLVINRVHIS